MLRTRILDALPSSLHSVKLALYGSERQTLLHTIQVINDAQKERKEPTSTKPVQTTSNIQANSTEGLRPSRRQRERSWSRGRGERGRGRGNRGRGHSRERGTWR